MNSMHSHSLNSPIHLGLNPLSILKLPKFKLSTYLNMDEISPPPVFGQVSGVTNWEMCANNSVGDCVLAGAAHNTKLWNAQAGKPIPTFSDATCTKQYFALTGGLDTGLDMDAFASWWQKTGLTDDAGNIHKILAYADIQSLDHLIKAVYAFGVCGLGVYFPSTAIQQFDNQQPWDVAQGAVNEGGHYIPIVARNSASNLVCVTWSRLQAMTYAFIEQYAMCIIAYISPEYLTNDVSPRNLNLAQLNADLAGLANA